jgi:hypothetical protein
MLLFLVFLALTVAVHLASEGEGDKRGVKENFFLVLTFIFGAITIYLGIVFFINDSLQLPNPYSFHW